MNDLVATLHSGRVLVMDGAMGTELQRRGGDPGVFAKDLTTAIHSDSTRAGASVVLTNTFQINPITPAIKAARAARPAPEFVLGAFGPLRGGAARIAPLLRACRGLDGVLLETWSSLTDLRMISKAWNETHPPLFVSFTYHRDRSGWRTFTQATPEGCARAARRCGAAAVGVNCGRELDMKGMLEIVKRYHDVSALPTFVRPNAGTPRKTAAGWVYPRTPAALAEGLPALLEEGIAMIGGCCGTTPAHIEAFREIVDEWNQ